MSEITFADLVRIIILQENQDNRITRIMDSICRKNVCRFGQNVILQDSQDNRITRIMGSGFSELQSFLHFVAGRAHQDKRIMRIMGSVCQKNVYESHQNSKFGRIIRIIG